MSGTLLAPLGLALLAAGTPRQAAALFGGAAGLPARRMLRCAGLALLAGSLAAAVSGEDRGRGLVAWIALSGMEALAVALLCSLASAWKARRPATPRHARGARPLPTRERSVSGAVKTRVKHRSRRRIGARPRGEVVTGERRP